MLITSSLFCVAFALLAPVKKALVDGHTPIFSQSRSDALSKFLVGLLLLFTHNACTSIHFLIIHLSVIK